MATALDMFTIGIFNQHCRYLTEFWRCLGFVPNLNYYKCKFRKRLARDKLQDLHKCLKVILKGITEVHRMGGIHTNILGREDAMKPWIHFVIGDASGINEVFGHFNHHGKCLCLYRDCRCSFDEMGDAGAYCEYITLEELKSALETADKHGVDNDFVPLSDNVYDIHGMVPPEGLHTFGSGNYGTLLDTMHDVVGIEHKNTTDKETVNDLHLLIVEATKRQSELDMPQPMVRNGIMDGTQMEATEKCVNVLALVLVLKTKAGQLLFKRHCERNSLRLSKMLKTAILILSCEKWCHSNVHLGDVDRSGPAIRELKHQLLKHFPCGKYVRRSMVGKYQNFMQYLSFPST